MKEKALQFANGIFKFFRDNFWALLFLVFLLQISFVYIFYLAYYKNVEAGDINISSDILLNQKLIEQFNGALAQRQAEFSGILEQTKNNPFDKTDAFATSSTVE